MLPKPFLLFLSIFLPTCLGLQMTMTGRLHCNATHPDPAKQTATIELWEWDGGWFGFDDDDFLGRTTINTLEPFEVRGSELEWDTLQPYLLIYHRCGKEDREVSTLLRVDLGDIPGDPLSLERKATSDLGTIDLSWKSATIDFWSKSDFYKKLERRRNRKKTHSRG